MARRHLTALFLGAPKPLAMGILGRWLEDGHRVAAVWHAARFATEEVLRRDAGEAVRRPMLSMRGLAGLFAFEAEAVPRLAASPGLIEQAAALRPDVVLSAMFMDRIPPAMIAGFRGRILNIHPALLPAYRGATPIPDMLWDETIDRHSGLTLHEVTAGLDEGPIVAQAPVAFPDSGAIQDYLRDLVQRAGDMLRDTVPAYLDGRVEPRPQPATGASHCRLRLSELAIDPATDTLRRVGWLCRTIGQFATFAVAGSPRPIQVNQLLETLGPPTGAPVEFGLNTADVDLVDARVRLTRG
jgi:methionyl-tRNA formyltransferase